MKILFFDTETTGLPKNWKAPVHQLDNWPRLVQIAWLVYDSNGNLLEEHDYVIKPVGFIIPSGASAVHKITTEKALEIGSDLLTILNIFSSSINACDLIVAHNYSYDYNIMGSELLRNGLENSLYEKEHTCTMNASTEFCKIPGPYGYKWPKLEELYKILFDESFNAHNALDDIFATARCFWELKKKKVIEFTDIIIGSDINIKDWNNQYLRSLLRHFKSSREDKNKYEDDFSNIMYPQHKWPWTENGIGIGSDCFFDKYDFSIKDDMNEDNWSNDNIPFTGTCVHIHTDSDNQVWVAKCHYYKSDLIRFKSYYNGRLRRTTKLYNNKVWEDIAFYLDESNYEEVRMIIDLELEDSDDLMDHLPKKFEYSCLYTGTCKYTKRVNYRKNSSIESIWSYENSILKEIESNKEYPDKGEIMRSSLLKKMPYTMKENPYKLTLENWECTQVLWSENRTFQLLHTYHFTPVDWGQPSKFRGNNLVSYGESQTFNMHKGNLWGWIKLEKRITHNNFGDTTSIKSLIYASPKPTETKTLQLLSPHITEKELLRDAMKYITGSFNDNEIDKYIDEYNKFILSIKNEIITPIYYYQLGDTCETEQAIHWRNGDDDFKIWRSKFSDAKPGDRYYAGHLSKREEESYLRDKSGRMHSGTIDQMTTSELEKFTKDNDKSK